MIRKVQVKDDDEVIKRKVKKKRVTVTKPKKSINKRKYIKKRISKKKKSVVKNHGKSFRDIFA